MPVPDPLGEDAAESDRFQTGLQGVGTGEDDIGKRETHGNPRQGGQAELIQGGQGLVEGVGGIDTGADQNIRPPGYLGGPGMGGRPLIATDSGSVARSKESGP